MCYDIIQAVMDLVIKERIIASGLFSQDSPCRLIRVEIEFFGIAE
jgi:hypothetical protein